MLKAECEALVKGVFPGPPLPTTEGVGRLFYRSTRASVVTGLANSGQTDFRYFVLSTSASIFGYTSICFYIEIVFPSGRPLLTVDSSDNPNSCQ